MGYLALGLPKKHPLINVFLLLNDIENNRTALILLLILGWNLLLINGIQFSYPQLTLDVSIQIIPEYCFGNC